MYFFRDKKDKILYIGKATSLRDRVRSYFNTDIVNTRSPLILKMLNEFGNVEYTKTDSVLEALVLEAYLIKKYQPEANIKEKDNKSFNFVIITKEDFPRVLVVRQRELEKMDYDVAYTFGPFPNGSQLREAMKIIRKMFPFRDKCEPYNPRVTLGKNNYPSMNTSRDAEFFNHIKNAGKIRACFNRQIGLCPGVCSGEISQEDYAKQIKNIVLFFQGNKRQIVKNLEKQMKSFAVKKEFEKANINKRTIFALNHIRDVSLIKEQNVLLSGPRMFRIESYDIAHMSGKNVVGVMTVVEDGEINKSEYRKFKIKEDPGVNDTKALKEVLSRRLAHIEWRFPSLIVVDGGVAQKRAVEKILQDNGVRIPVVSVVKDERHRPKEILGDKKWLKYEREILLSNSEAHRYAIGFHKKLREKIL